MKAPATVSAVKLSDAQERALRRIVKSNGAGAFPQFHAIPPTIRILFDNGLVQGKSGQEFMVVHTREGLQWLRDKDGRPDMRPWEVSL